ncbi:MAG TPA: cobalamin-binding protein [Desulfobacteraceae bacterium]|nr:cobalamin-binding protein [Desulfobacteraceae bacterium]
MEKLYISITEGLISGDNEKTEELTQQALESGLQAQDILDKALLKGMEIVGARFKNGEMYIPEVLKCARTMHCAIDVLAPYTSENDTNSRGSIVIGTVQGDLHDIGKNLVGMMCEGAGFEVIDLGIDIKAQEFVKAVEKNGADILAMSALLTTTMPKMVETLHMLEKAGCRENLKVMIGGAPVTEDFANEIGADGFAPNAASAVDKAKEFMEEIESPRAAA